MAKQYLLALDAGTGSVRAVVFTPQGEQVACVQHEWTHTEDPRYPGSMDFDWVHNWALACGCIRGALGESGLGAARRGPGWQDRLRRRSGSGAA